MSWAYWEPKSRMARESVISQQWSVGGEGDDAVLHGGDAGEGFDGQAQGLEGFAATLEDLLDEGANADDLGACGFGEAAEAEDGLAGGEVVGRNDELDHAALGVRGREGQVDLVGHGDGLILAGVDDRQTEMQGGHQRGGNAGYFCSEDLGGADSLEAAGKLAAAAVHQPGIDLMIDEAVYLQDAIPQILTIAQDAIFEFCHSSS